MRNDGLYYGIRGEIAYITIKLGLKPWKAGSVLFTLHFAEKIRLLLYPPASKFGRILLRKHLPHFESPPYRQIKENLLTASRNCDCLDIAPDALDSLSTSTSCEADSAHDLNCLTNYMLQHNTRMRLQLRRWSGQMQICVFGGECTDLENRALTECISKVGPSCRYFLTSIHACKASVSRLICANLKRMTGWSTSFLPNVSLLNA